jgi:hypothetical protein
MHTGAPTMIQTMIVPMTWVAIIVSMAFLPLS